MSRVINLSDRRPQPIEHTSPNGLVVARLRRLADDLETHRLPDWFGGRIGTSLDAEFRVLSHLRSQLAATGWRRA
jgi:hypothetical protein